MLLVASHSHSKKEAHRALPALMGFFPAPVRSLLFYICMCYFIAYRIIHLL